MTDEESNNPLLSHPLLQYGPTSRGTHRVTITAEFRVEDEIGFRAEHGVPFMESTLASTMEGALGRVVGNAAKVAWEGQGIEVVGPINVFTGQQTTAV